jgi:hypothetical protein
MNATGGKSRNVDQSLLAVVLQCLGGQCLGGQYRRIPPHLGKAGPVKRGWTTVGDIGYLDDEG